MIKLLILFCLFGLYVPVRKGLRQFILDAASLIMITAAALINLYKGLRKWVKNTVRTQRRKT